MLFLPVRKKIPLFKIIPGFYRNMYRAYALQAQLSEAKNAMDSAQVMSEIAKENEVLGRATGKML